MSQRLWLWPKYACSGSGSGSASLLNNWWVIVPFAHRSLSSFWDSKGAVFQNHILSGCYSGKFNSQKSVKMENCYKTYWVSHRHLSVTQIMNYLTKISFEITEIKPVNWVRPILLCRRKMALFAWEGGYDMVYSLIVIFFVALFLYLDLVSR